MMNFYIDDVQIPFLTLSDNQVKIIFNDPTSGTVRTDFVEILTNTINRRWQECFERMKEKYDPILVEHGITQAPIDPIEYADFVVGQPFYQDKIIPPPK